MDRGDGHLGGTGRHHDAHARTHPKQPFGILHGGASVVLAETVANLGTYNLIDRKNELVTAVGTPLNRGQRSWSGRSASPTRRANSSASRAAP
jgi:hypothetical protein